MKQGISQLSVVDFSNLELTNVESITFYFKAIPDQDATVIKKATWKADGTGDVSKDSDDKFLINWSESEAYLIGQTLWIEPKIKISGQTTMPEVKPQRITINLTIIGESD